MGEPELERDRMIEAALNRLQDPGTYTEAEWAQLHRRIVLAAAGRLARRRRWNKSWVDQTASWARSAIAIGLAAGLAALLLIRQTQLDPEQSGSETATSVLLALTHEDAERELVDQTVGGIGGSSEDWLINAAGSR